MQYFSRKIFLYLLFTGILFTGIGIYGVFETIEFSNYLVYILAFFFFTGGIKNFTKGFEFKSIIPEFHWGLYILVGAMEIIISLSLLRNPFPSQINLIIYAGIFMILKGIFIAFNLFLNRPSSSKLFHSGIASSIIDILFGTLLVTFPFIAQQFIVLCIAWYILFSGAHFILAAFSFKKRIEK